MSRLKRFESHRFLGDRRTMRVYDCDDAAQFAIIESEVEQHRLLLSNLVQTFAPDELDEAINRSFTPLE